MKPRIRNILYATDLSPNSVHALGYATDLAEKYGARIAVLHVREGLWSTDKMLVGPFLNDEALAESSRKKNDHARSRILERLQALAGKTLLKPKEAGGCIDRIDVVEGYPADEILNMADILGSDVIVMGTHGKGAVRHTYFGSMSKRVLRRARIPVLVVPLPKG
jgi:nucleotide-binding universal stress UspA family protein